MLQLGKFYPIKGGVEQVEYSLMSGLSERGVYCDMLCATHGVIKNSERFLNDYSQLITTKTWFNFSATMISPSMITTLRRICNEYDIIHLHHPDPMAALSLFLSGYKGKVVLHWHSDIVKQKKLLRLYKPLQDWIIKRADVIIGTTPIYVEQSPFLLHVQHKITCLPIGVSPVKVNKEKVFQIQNLYHRKKIIFTLGRLVEYKGHEYLIEAARHLNDDFIILIGGDGPLRDKLQQQIDENHLNDKVKLLGRISDEDLSAYYGACTLFCLPSIFKTEAFGLVQIEAMSCSKPVVTTEIPESGVPWVNQNGYSGLNVPPCNAEALAQAILSITANKERYLQFCNNALNRYLACFTQDQMVDRCLDIYNQLFFTNKSEKLKAIA